MSEAWDAIERVGLKLGANAEMIRKWRVRGVSASWKVRFLTDPEGRAIPLEAFDAPPGPKRFAEQAA